MKKKLWIWVIALLIALPAVSGVVTASGLSNMEKHHKMQDMIGNFQYENGKVVGKYVNFTINPKTGEISDYSVDNTTVFTSISYENEGIGKIRVHGAKFTYAGVWGNINWSWNKKNMSMNEGWRLVQAVDTPVGILHMVVDGRDTITYTLSSGINITLRNSTVILSGKISAYLLISNGEISIKNNKIMITTTNEIKNGDEHKEWIHNSASILFIAPQHWNVPKDIKVQIMRGFENNLVGGEMYIHSGGAEFINYTYGMQAKIMIRERTHIRMEISGDKINGGKVLLINMDNTAFTYDKHHKLIVKLDGKEIRETSVKDVMNGGSQPKYAMEEQEGVLTLMVYIPHFSEHTLDVESKAVGNSSITNILENPLIVLIGIVMIIAIVGIAVWAVKSR